MKKSGELFSRIIASLLLALFLVSCVVDRFQIVDGSRNPVFIPMVWNNNKGHLFWYYNTDVKGKILKSKNNKKVIFDKGRDTMIFVHGWQGNGSLGWTQHSIMTGPMRFLGPVAALISIMYNVPGRGATMPDVQSRLSEYNVAIFDWQQYNNTAGDYETSQNLSQLEQNLKEPPKNWPDIPENLAEEIELIIAETGYDRQIILTAHSFGNQVVTRAYNMLSEQAKARIKVVVFLDPFTTNYFDYMNKKVAADYHWLTGATTPWIKDDLTQVLKKSEIIEKTVLVYSSDIGKAWDVYFAKPLNIRSYDDNFVEYRLWQNYGWRTVKKHDDVIDSVWTKKKFDQKLGIY
jgi:pimeloyl-ACP methyl ester carboxylesterase